MEMNLEQVMTWLQTSEELNEEDINIEDIKEKVQPSTVYRADNVISIAYMLGITEEQLTRTYGTLYIEKKAELESNIEASIVRQLSLTRSLLMGNFGEVDKEIKYNLANLDRLELFTLRVDFKTLRKNGVEVIQANYTGEKYFEYISRLIEEHLCKCKNMFPEYIRFDFVKDLFVPKYQKKGTFSSEISKYKSFRVYYPFGVYMVWNPVDKGNILENDSKILSILYEQHGETFYDYYAYQDATEETKGAIYNFIREAKKVEIVVDCENVNPYKFYSVLKNLNEEELAAISKITLYDDTLNGSKAWDYVGALIHIPVDHVEVERVTNLKSLVDMKMSLGVSKSYYEDHVDSFILWSSDSDFYGLITSLPFVNFLVMYEFKNAGTAIKTALKQKGIQTCCMDDFYMQDAKELKSVVLKKSLEDKLPMLLGQNARELVDQLYNENYIEASKEERDIFFEKKMKKLKLEIDKDGKYQIVIP